MLADALNGIEDAEAISMLRAACAAGDRSPVTVLNLAIAEDRAGAGDRARELMRGVAVLLPDWDEPVLRLAESFRRDGLLPQAAQAYDAVLDINPRREEALVARAALLIMQGDGVGAQPLLLRCVGINPNRAEAWDALGLALMLTGSADTAESAFAEAQRLAPANLDYAMHRVQSADRAGTLEAELARLRAAADEDPLNPFLLANAGLALERLGRHAEAIDSLAAAIAMAPESAPLTGLSGTLLARANRLAEAATVLGRAIELDPTNPALLNDRAAVLMRLHRHAAAQADLQAALELRPDDPNVLCNLATALVSLGRQEEGEATARMAIRLAPDAMLPRRTLANALPYRQDVGGAALLSALQEVAARLPRGLAPAFANVPDPRRKLKIGLLSGSLRTHPVGWLTIAGFEALDPGEFALVCFAQNAGTDPIARRFRAISAEWHDVDALDDPALAQLARDREIDVLIDLGGYGDAGRLPACAYRLAPVQVKWVGMQTHSTGLAEMDWMLSDRWETPPELERFYTERMLRLRDGYLCYSPPAYAPDVCALPALTAGMITFGCFNNLAKITPRTVQNWATILKRVPGSRMVLKTHQFSEPDSSERVTEAFARLGIGRERIELRGASPHRAFLAEYGQIDIVLDPFPYSGGLTTCEALWMGVPVVALPGEIFASRHSASHLNNVGLGDWVADSAETYVELAVAKASDIRGLASLRAALRQRVRESPLCDAARFGRSLGAALRLAWHDWCERALVRKSVFSVTERATR